MKYILVLILCSLFIGNVQSQVDIDRDVQRLFDRYANQNRQQPYILGWKIQLLSDTDRRIVEREKINFQRDFFGLNAQWHHDDPYYVLQVSNLAYIRELDALHMYHRIRRKYPSAILVIERLNPEIFID